MSFNYAPMRATAERLIRRFGQPGVILRPGALDESTYPVTVGADTEAPCVVVVDQFSVLERAGTLVQEGDVKLLISPETITPTTADRLRVGGVEYALQSVSPVSPGGTVLLFEARGRA